MNIDFKPFFVVISSPWVYNIYIYRSIIGKTSINGGM